MSNFLSKEVAFNFVFGMKFQLYIRWGCCRKPLVIRLYLCLRKVESRFVPTMLTTRKPQTDRISCKIWARPEKSRKTRSKIKVLWLSWFCALWIPSMGPNCHHDNTPPHAALVLCDHFAKRSTNIVPKPPSIGWFGTVWLLPIQWTQKTAQGSPFWLNWGDESWIEEGIGGQLGNRI